ncbi:hypothetical protein R6867_04545, partial [Mycobacterium tuberculosis]
MNVEVHSAPGWRAGSSPLGYA